MVLSGILLALAPPALRGQDVVASRPAAAVDSLLVRSDAESAQARFERDRRRLVPRAPSGSWAGSCDEIVGRMCMRFEGGSDWWPTPESPELTEARRGLLQRLAGLAELLPGDSWILGQRIRYLIEAGSAGEARALAISCGLPEGWWCDALAGLAAHVQSDFPEAERSFDRALAAMPDSVRTDWEDIEWLMDADGRDLLDDEDADPERIADRFWRWSDPLFLIEGNDFRTEMLARRAVNRISRDSRNGYSMPWGSDLEELLVRYGWEIGWEVTNPRASGQIGATPSAVGHQHPESRDYSAPGAALQAVTSTEPGQWNPRAGGRTTTGYAPIYAPVVAPARVEILRFPRGRETVLIALVEMEPDTSYHRSHGHEPLAMPKAFADRPAQRGLFLVSQDQESPRRVIESGGSGALMLTVPAGEYVLGAEVWYPDSARAGRYRTGIDLPGLAPDVAATSDLVLTDAMAPEPTDLADLAVTLNFGPFRAGEDFRVVWEITGIGLSAETLDYQLRLQKTEGGLLSRIGGFLGLGGPPRPVELAWTELSPDALVPNLRWVRLVLPPDIKPGEYRIQLQLRSVGRAPLLMERLIEVLPAR